MSRRWQFFADIAEAGFLHAIVIALHALFRRVRNVDSLVPIVSISYSWLTQSHPDPAGLQLSMLVGTLQRKLYRGNALLAAAQAYGFAELGVFLGEPEAASWRRQGGAIVGPCGSMVHGSAVPALRIAVSAVCPLPHRLWVHLSVRSQREGLCPDGGGRGGLPQSFRDH